MYFFFFKQKTAYEMRISDWSSDVCSSDLPGTHLILPQNFLNRPMKVESPFFFEDEAMLAKVFNPRTKRGPAPANPLPEHIRLKRHDEWIDKLRRQQEADRKSTRLNSSH